MSGSASDLEDHVEKAGRGVEEPGESRILVVAINLAEISDELRVANQVQFEFVKRLITKLVNAKDILGAVVVFRPKWTL
jgi:hypothetical protein